MEKRERPSDFSESDSEGEGPRNRVGNIPMRWYKEFDHIGYGVDGKAIAKKPRKDALEELVAKSDDPKFWYVHVMNVTNV